MKALAFAPAPALALPPAFALALAFVALTPALVLALALAPALASEPLMQARFERAGVISEDSSQCVLLSGGCLITEGSD